ncbi:MAG: oxidative damage protection protein [Gammaproteobacteria bacterium]|nr:oxidative damage protection protein [Gammaproteobacteria bacterium]
MSDSVFCIKLQKDAEKLPAPPFPGDLGEKIYQHVSKDAWGSWLNHQTMLINEYRLSLIDPQAREFLRLEMKKYFFGEGSEKPSGFVPENEK